MTVQAQDRIEYRNKSYKLIGNPLYSFIQENKIVFEDYTTANSCGYDAEYKIENNKLYITDLQSTNYTFYDIFKSKLPVLTTWFSGIIKFGFGHFQSNHWWGTYENYLWLKIVNGEIIEKRIIKDFEEYADKEVFSFGKYKNEKVSDVLLGKITKSEKKAVKDYIQSILDYYLNETNENEIVIPKINFSTSDHNLINLIKRSEISYEIDNYNILFFSKDLNILESLIYLLEKVFTSIFFSLDQEYVGLKKREISIDSRSVLLNSDFDYINWALKNVERFSYLPTALSLTYKSTKLLGFEFNKKSQNEIELNPLYLYQNHSFSRDVIEINRKKFYENYSVYFDEDCKEIFYNLENISVRRNFAHYLNEEDSTEEEEQERGEEIYYDNEPYYNSNDWLIDASGTDDEDTMNDVYWNLD